jgi:G3E family GTPase
VRLCEIQLPHTVHVHCNNLGMPGRALVSARYHLQRVIITVSAVSGADTLERFTEPQAQLGWADAVVLTHGDLASSAQLAATRAWLDKLAPSAVRLNVIQGEAAPECLLSLAKKIRPLGQM